MSHLAIWEAPESGAESEWGDLVTDEEYSNNRSIATPDRGGSTP
jgi:hypothetical protein